jgi:hypothetical protein
MHKPVWQKETLFVFDRELSFTNHAHKFNASQDAFGGVEGNIPRHSGRHWPTKTGRRVHRDKIIPRFEREVVKTSWTKSLILSRQVKPGTVSAIESASDSPGDAPGGSAKVCGTQAIFQTPHTTA